MSDDYAFTITRSHVEIEDDGVYCVDETAKFTADDAEELVRGLVFHGGGKSPAARWTEAKNQASEVESSRETMEDGTQFQ